MTTPKLKTMTTMTTSMTHRYQNGDQEWKKNDISGPKKADCSNRQHVKEDDEETVLSHTTETTRTSCCLLDGDDHYHSDACFDISIPAAFEGPRRQPPQKQQDDDTEEYHIPLNDTVDNHESISDDDEEETLQEASSRRSRSRRRRRSGLLQDSEEWSAEQLEILMDTRYTALLVSRKEGGEQQEIWSTSLLQAYDLTGDEESSEEGSCEEESKSNLFGQYETIFNNIASAVPTTTVFSSLNL